MQQPGNRFKDPSSSLEATENTANGIEFGVKGKEEGGTGRGIIMCSITNIMDSSGDEDVFEVSYS